MGEFNKSTGGYVVIYLSILFAVLFVGIVGIVGIKIYK